MEYTYTVIQNLPQHDRRKLNFFRG